MGEDPEIIDNPILVDVKWMSLNEVCERDRSFLWASRLLCVGQFMNELEKWSDDISYPTKKES